MVALYTILLGVIACAVWHVVQIIAKKVWRYHCENDLILLIHKAFMNIGDWLVRQRESLTLNLNQFFVYPSPYKTAA